MVTLADLFDDSGQAVEQVQLHRPRDVGHGERQVHVVGPLLHQQLEEDRVGLDVHPGPALAVEPAGHIVDFRVEGAEIDVEAALYVLQRPAQHHVLEVLGVADHRRQVRAQGAVAIGGLFGNRTTAHSGFSWHLARPSLPSVRQAR